ncbi:T5orf172 multi-domain protein [Pyrenophora tritici-repentis]|uniref:Bacteriophage T5 Orf172 DNA-binding domain-containing protein n=2 Tax=Pyrenophora tritici-repentis TaxID=45151 RepID=A0A2W1CZQ5_9PLEO|nr:uncharacterized protein PTRG_03395 [Pyrenophora tritici-repentis Pt-1C-BFP]KAF7451484.1 T5orf172 multi-domain protein [Pyrenophora tritici-repentis]EDU45918.1 conserved hypothetical protein [Pyrenophora tritici-repentis Pt-1C-BFP]KAG9385849.1 T5orf172 multi-domain protein [Pyrenophora tritici-repentis]KAI1514861.1 hypothetical protein Ptr86124_006184 [Pyrenophora tritici-repentis]KAI1672958.1 T5orf172 domain containing protein [Pyrenophora tritici-repentis]
MIPGSFPEIPLVNRRFNPLVTQPVSYSLTAGRRSRSRPYYTCTQSDPTLEFSFSAIPERDDAPSPTASSTSCKRRREEIRQVSSSWGEAHQQNPLNILPRGSRRAGTTSNLESRSLPHQGQDTSLSPITRKTARSTHEKLRELLESPLAPKEGPGFVYVLRDPKSPESGFKIGVTTRPYDYRTTEHRKICRFVPDVRYVSGNGIPYCGLLERLVHADLEDHRQLRPCGEHKYTNRGKQHEEWFVVSEDFAKDTVKRWETFLRREKPYNLGHLNIVWKYLLEERSPISLDVLAWSHDDRRAQWTKILAPLTRYDHIKAYHAYARTQLTNICITASRVQFYLRKFFWQFSTLFYSLVTLVLCRNSVAFSAFVVVLGFSMVTVLSHVPSTSKKHQKTPTKMIQKPAAGGPENPISIPDDA